MLFERPAVSFFGGLDDFLAFSKLCTDFLLSFALFAQDFGRLSSESTSSAVEECGSLMDIVRLIGLLFFHTFLIDGKILRSLAGASSPPVSSIRAFFSIRSLANVRNKVERVRLANLANSALL